MKILNGLAEGQVLQRRGSAGAYARLTGAARENGPVIATLRAGPRIVPGWKNRAVGRARAGEFTAELRAIPAGGPYRLELRTGNRDRASRTFYVGDVWLLAGQSNMQGYGDMTVTARPHPLIRLFSMRREWRRAEEPLHVLAESPDSCHSGGAACSPEDGERLRRTALKGASLGLYFAQAMMAQSGVPQGLIATAHGGTSMTQWDPGLKARRGGSLYGSMFLSLEATGQPIAGMLWYQGENDTTAADAPPYTARMKKLVAAVRRDLRQPRLPWVIAQLGRVFGALDGAHWNHVQEQQRVLPREVSNLATVATIDLPLDDGVHIGAAGYPRLGKRFARAMQSLLAGSRPQVPQLRSIGRDKNLPSVPHACIDVTFDQVAAPLRSFGDPAGFTLMQPDGTIVPIIYRTSLEGNIVRLHCCRSIDPGTVLHYGHGPAPRCTITDANDSSLPVFGPLPVFKPAAYLPFVGTWRVTGVIKKPARVLARLKCPAVEDFPHTTKTYPSAGNLAGFVNEHEAWIGKSGHAYFDSTLTLPEPMKLRLLLGYDGPFRLWIDGKSFFRDLNGSNPCLPDQRAKTISLSARPHHFTVAMDINDGRAWGFFLRFVREDLSLEQVQSGHYVRPGYST